MNLLALEADSVVRMNGDGGEFKFEVQHPNKKWGQVYFFPMGSLLLIIPWTQLPKERV